MFPVHQVPNGPRSSIFAPVPRCPNPRSQMARNQMAGQMQYFAWSRPDRNGDNYLIRCGKNKCSICRVINARRISHAIHLSAPTNEFAVTQVGSTAAEIGAHMRRFIAAVRDAVPQFQCVWAAEVNPGGTGVHVHGYFHAGLQMINIRPSVFRRAQQRAHVGLHWDVRSLPTSAGASYFGYPLKSLADPELAENFVALNNSSGRRVSLIHATRGFWRDGPTGPPISRSAAERISYRRAKEKLWAGAR